MKTANTFGLQHLTPVLVVDDVEPWLRFWIDKLGFTAPNRSPATTAKLVFASAKAGDVEVMYQTRASVLAERPEAADEFVGHSTVLFITVDHLDRIEKAVSGAPVVKPRHDTFYGTTELYVKEPGGNLVGYRQLERMTGKKQDPCVLDTFRAAVAQALDPNLPTEKCVWWHYSGLRKKNRRQKTEGRRRKVGGGSKAEARRQKVKNTRQVDESARRRGDVSTIHQCSSTICTSLPPFWRSPKSEASRASTRREGSTSSMQWCGSALASTSALSDSPRHIPIASLVILMTDGSERM
jgi:uncharacterized glyoxalase superfamily protein PhnB